MPVESRWTTLTRPLCWLGFHAWKKVYGSDGHAAMFFCNRWGCNHRKWVDYRELKREQNND